MSHYITKKFEGRNSLFSLQAYYATEALNTHLETNLIQEGGSFYQGGFVHWIGNEQDYIRSQEWLNARLKEDVNWGANFYTRQMNKLNTFIQSQNEIHTRIESLSKRDLYSYAQKLLTIAGEAIAPAYYTDFYAYNAPEWIRNYIPTKILSDEDFKLVTSHRHISFSKEYEYTLAKVTLDIEHHSPESLARMYYWVRDNYQHIGTVTPEVVIQDLRTLSKDDAQKTITYVEQELATENVLKDTLLEQRSLNLFQKSILTLLSHFVDLQDKRKAAVFITNNILNAIYKKLLTDYSKSERNIIIQSATYDWILNPEIHKETLLAHAQKAETGMLHVINTNTVFGKQAEKQFYTLTQQSLSEHITQLTGYIANKGIAHGTVKVIHKISDFKTFNEGDVLVSSMTRPEMVPLMKKACAFVTDEGGITSHAAIISREMNKPCIIGTKIATQVLKNGDHIEVDAEKGMVTIIHT